MDNKAEFCKAIKQHQNSMYALAFSIVKNEHDAGDVVGEAILKAYSKIHMLKDDDLFKPWILRIVQNTAIELLRKRSITCDVSQREEIAETIKGIDKESQMVLRGCINELKQPYRTVLVLYYYEGLSTKEIADVTSSNAVSIRQQLTRGRKLLKESLEKEGFIYEGV